MIDKQSLEALFNETEDLSTLCRYVYDVLTAYKT